MAPWIKILVPRLWGPEFNLHKVILWSPSPCRGMHAPHTHHASVSSHINKSVHLETQVKQYTSCVGVHRLWYHWGQCEYPASGPPPETILESRSHAAAGTILFWVSCTAIWSHSDIQAWAAAEVCVHGLLLSVSMALSQSDSGSYWHQRLFRCPGSRCHLRPWWCTRVMLLPCHADLGGLFCHLGWWRSLELNCYESHV